MNERQRVVVVIAVGLAIVACVQTINELWFAPGGGWFGYAPNTDIRFEGDDGRPEALMRGVMWLVGVALWSVVAIRLMRRDD